MAFSRLGHRRLPDVAEDRQDGTPGVVAGWGSRSHSRPRLREGMAGVQELRLLRAEPRFKQLRVAHAREGVGHVLYTGLGCADQRLQARHLVVPLCHLGPRPLVRLEAAWSHSSYCGEAK